MFESTRGRHTLQGEQMVLESVSAHVKLQNLCSETTVVQKYRNTEQSPIEAIYTFPIPSTATLMELVMERGDKKMQGTIMPKSDAEEKYEDTVISGDTAIMLEQTDSGLFTMNIGNVMAGEEVTVKFTYAELLQWNENNLRFTLPTTVAPRYGSALPEGLQPHQLPEYSSFTSTRFDLDITVTGILTDSEICSPSHSVAINRSDRMITISLKLGKSMDRDFVLLFKTKEQPEDSVIFEPDIHGGFTAFASFIPKIPQAEAPSPRSIKLIIDCSGSMTGDSIAQTREAISQILKLLRPEDYFNVIFFGSTYKAAFDRQVNATKENIRYVEQILFGLRADMGGTEMLMALQAAVNMKGPEMPSDILLVTDGEIWEVNETVKFAADSEHRFFTVGVGSAVSESLLRKLATVTGGACEFVYPNEGMSEKIVRHFKRIFMSGASMAEILWPVQVDQVYPMKIANLFNGDTIHVFAKFHQKPTGKVQLKMHLEDSTELCQEAKLEESQKNIGLSGGTISRIAMQHVLSAEPDEIAKKIAVEYQLMTQFTSYLVIDIRNEDEKATALPRVKKAPNMIPSGWHGRETASTRGSSTQFIYDSHELELQCCMMPESSPSTQLLSQDSVLLYSTPEEFAAECNNILNELGKTGIDSEFIVMLPFSSLPDGIDRKIRKFSNELGSDISMHMVRVVFLLIFAESEAGSILNREIKRAISWEFKRIAPPEELKKRMEKMFSGISRFSWGNAEQSICP